MYVHEVLVNRLGGLSLPRKSVVRLTDRPDMTLDVYRGRKTTIQQQQEHIVSIRMNLNKHEYRNIDFEFILFINQSCGTKSASITYDYFCK